MLSAGLLVTGFCCGTNAAQVLYLDNFEQFEIGTDLTDVTYTPASGPTGATALTRTLNGTPTIGVWDLHGSASAYFSNPDVPSKSEYQALLAQPQTNQVLEISWRLLIPSTNTGAGMFLFSVPTSNSRQDYNSPLAFLDTGNIVIFTNKPAMQPRAMTVVGSWARFANRYMTNRLILDYPERKLWFFLNGQQLANLPLGFYFTNVLQKFYFDASERDSGCLGNQFQLDDVEIVNLTEGWIETMRPTVAISTPKANQQWSNAIFTVTGTAKDNVAVSNVWVRANSNDWTQAVGTTHWSAAVSLDPGLNSIQAYAQDTGGNCSMTNKVPLTYILSDVVTVHTSGLGSTKPNLNGKLLQLESVQTLTATAGKNYVFSNWVNGAGIEVTNSKILKFTVESNLVLTANFVTNPFFAVAGNYAGLFYNTNEDGITVSNAGYFTANVKPTVNGNAFTAKLQQGAKSYPLSGQLSLNGGWGTHSVKGTPGWGVGLQLDLGGRDEITGQISNSVWTAQVRATRSHYSRTQPAPETGQYTLIIPGSDDPADLPAGHGAAAVNVSPAGVVTVNGVLGDGTVLSQSTFVSKDGQWPLFASPYSKKGILIGWMTFTNNTATTNNLEGVVGWIKPEGTGTKLYPDGFDWPYDIGTNNVLGSAFTNRAPLLNWTNGVLILENGNLTQSVTNNLQIGNTGKITGTNKLTGTITTTGIKAGLIRGGVVVDPVKKTTKTFNGAVLQNQNIGYASFLGTNQSGSARLTRE
jgi:hypothetical protein